MVVLHCYGLYELTSVAIGMVFRRPTHCRQVTTAYFTNGASVGDARIELYVGCQVGQREFERIAEPDIGTTRPSTTRSDRLYPQIYICSMHIPS